MKGSNSKVLQVLSKRQRRALRMLDFQVQCPAKTLRARGSTSKMMQIHANTTKMLGFVSKLLQGPQKTRDSRLPGEYFFDALDSKL